MNTKSIRASDKIFPQNKKLRLENPKAKNLL